MRVLNMKFRFFGLPWAAWLHQTWLETLLNLHAHLKRDTSTRHAVLELGLVFPAQGLRVQAPLNLRKHERT